MVKQSEDEAARTTRTYDALGRSLATVQLDLDDLEGDALRTSVIVYDDANLKTLFTVSNANQTVTTFDGLGQVLAEQLLANVDDEFEPVSDAREFAYDKAGNVVSFTDRNGLVKTFTYDNFGRKTGETWVDYDSEYAETYTYDQYGRIASKANNHVAYAYTYDDEGRIATTTITGLSEDPIVLTTTYDKFDRLIALEDSFGGMANYRYDQSDRLDRATLVVTDHNSIEQTYYLDWTYGDDDLLARIDRRQIGAGTNVRTAYGYDEGNRVTLIDHQTHDGTEQINVPGVDSARRLIRWGA